MATGASTADVAILLVDARHGVRVQSRRHARIARLLGITRLRARHQQDGPRRLRPRRVRRHSRRLRGDPRRRARVHAIPLSALHGDNVITRSDRTPWFDGPSLLEYLETVEVTRDLTPLPFRFPVQLVLRPDQDFRGYAGQMPRARSASAIPSSRGRPAAPRRVNRIVTYDGDLDSHSRRCR